MQTDEERLQSTFAMFLYNLHYPWVTLKLSYYYDVLHHLQRKLMVVAVVTHKK